MHVARIKSSHTGRRGRAREYESRLLRHTWREDGKVRHKTLANLSKMPDRVAVAVEAALKGEVLVPAGRVAVTVARALPHGHVAAVHAVAAKLALPALPGPAGRQRDLALALIISRVACPGSKLSTLAWRADTTLGPDLGIENASTDEVYAAMDWLQSRQDAIESRLARRHLAPAADPQRMALFDLSSSWLEGSHCPPGARGWPATARKAKSRSSTGCSPTPRAGPSRSGALRGTPPTPPPSPRLPGPSRTPSG
jgi:hypothetical protein